MNRTDIVKMTDHELSYKFRARHGDKPGDKVKVKITRVAHTRDRRDNSREQFKDTKEYVGEVIGARRRGSVVVDENKVTHRSFIYIYQVQLESGSLIEANEDQLTAAK